MDHWNAENNRLRKILVPIIALTIACSCADKLVADSATMTSDRDNTLVEAMRGDLSLGGGDAIYAGRTSIIDKGSRRRGVIGFDLSAAIPSGSTITSVTLTLHHPQSNNGRQTVRLHRLLADWGEGEASSPGGSGAPAGAGDATWLHTSYPSDYWSAPGGDYAASPSDSQIVADLGDYTWGSTDAMVQDVQGWLDDPASNFGWIVIGNEMTIQTVKRLASREWTEPTERPRLTIDFDAPIPGDLNGDWIVNGIDLGILLANWSIPATALGCRGTTPCAPDINEDGFVNGIDLGILLANWTLPTAR